MKLARTLAAGLLAAALLAPPISAQVVSVAGEWELRTKAKESDMTWKVLFAQDGESLKVTMTGPKGKELMGSGTLKEDRIEWSVKVPTPRGDMDVIYTGIVQGEEMAGEVQRGHLGKFEWTAAKKAS